MWTDVYIGWTMLDEGRAHVSLYKKVKADSLRLCLFLKHYFRLVTQQSVNEIINIKV